MSVEAIQYPTYQPAMRIVTAITRATEALVTTSFAHQYVDGIILRLLVPWNFGMTKANGRAGEITVVSPTQFTITIDTTLFDPFVIPPDIVLPDGTPTQVQYAQCVPFGELNEMLTAAVRNVLPYP